MCSEGAAVDGGTLVLPLAASKGQKVSGLPLGDLARGKKLESVLHPNTKLQREWQWARITTACTSSARDQHCSPAFSRVCKAQRQVLILQKINKKQKYFDFDFIVLSYLNMGAGGEPGLVGQHLIDVVEKAKARGCCFQTLQPLRVPAHPQKLSRVQVHQVVAVMSCSSLEHKV